MHASSKGRYLERAGLLLALSLALVPLACNRGPRLHPVRGEIFVNGQPAVGAVIHLHPRDKEQGKPAFATVEPDGSFQLMTLNKNDGAVAGDYGVTVCWYTERMDENEKITGPDRLGQRFTRQDTSGLTASVKPGKNDLPRFDLRVN